MQWKRETEEFLPEFDDQLDDEALASAIESDQRRRYAALFASPRWLDDVA